LEKRIYLKSKGEKGTFYCTYTSPLCEKGRGTDRKEKKKRFS